MLTFVIIICICTFLCCLLAYKHRIRWEYHLAGWVIALLAIAYGAWSVSQNEKKFRDHFVANLCQTACIYQRSIELMGHEHIPLENAPDNEIYQKICRLFQEGYQTHPTIPSMFTMRKDTEGKLTVFVAPGILGKDGRYNYDLFRHGESMSEWQTEGDNIFAADIHYASHAPQKDQSGEWMVLLAPIHRANGTVEAILSVKYRADDWYAYIKGAGHYPVSKALLLYVMCTVFLILWSELRLKHRAEKSKAERAEEHTRIVEQTAILTRTMLDSIPMACNLWDQDMNLIDCSLATVRMLGFKDKEECLQCYKERWPEFTTDGQRTHDLIRKYYDEAVAIGYYRFRGHLLDEQGCLFPIEVTFIRSMHQDIPVITSYVRDLRESEQLMELREVDERMRLMLDAAPIGCCLWDGNFQFIDCNLETVKMFGLENKAQFGDHFRYLLAEFQPNGRRSVDYAYELLEQVYERGTPLQLEWEHAKIDGSPLPVAVTAVRVRRGTDDVIAVFIRDLRELKKQEEERRHYAERLENANKAKSDFLATVSHELLTPLNGILGSAVLLKRTSLNKQQREFVNIINTSGESLVAMVNAILEFSHLDISTTRKKLKQFELIPFVQSIFDSIAPRAADKNLKVGICYDQRLPQLVQGDTERIRQVLLHLLDNAIKFTEHGHIQIDVSVQSIEESDVIVRFCITDTGIGIPADTIGKLFGTFFQADGSFTRSHDGLGIGLPLAERLVNLMKGKIGVESELGKGSRFWFELPLGNIQDLDNEYSFVIEPGHDSSIGVLPESIYAGEIHILIVEDNKITQIVIRKILINAGWTCDIVPNGLEAVNAVKNKHYDIILMDCQMPEMDGFDATSKIREWEITENRRRLPIIALTANTSEADTQRCFDSGMDAFYGKPIHSPALVRMIEKWYEKSQEAKNQ